MIAKFGSALFDKTIYSIQEIYTGTNMSVVNVSGDYLLKDVVFKRNKGKTYPEESVFPNIPSQVSPDNTTSDGDYLIIKDTPNKLVLFQDGSQDSYLPGLFLRPTKIYLPVGTIIKIYDLFNWVQLTEKNYEKRFGEMFSWHAEFPAHIAFVDVVFSDPQNPCATYIASGANSGQFTFIRPGTVTVSDQWPGETKQDIAIYCYALPQDDDVETGGDL